MFYYFHELIKMKIRTRRLNTRRRFRGMLEQRAMLETMSISGRWASAGEAIVASRPFHSI